MIGYVIWLSTGECVIGLGYPPSKLRPQQALKEGEIRISETCVAIIGNEKPYKFQNRETAEHIASAIKKAISEPWFSCKVEMWKD
jgi:hypothetical protein